MDYWEKKLEEVKDVQKPLDKIIENHQKVRDNYYHWSDKLKELE